MIYQKQDADQVREQKLEDRREDILHHALGSGLMKLFSKRQRKRFLFGLMLQ